jgi:tetratricopeptide (TPR) repeat protein
MIMAKRTVTWQDTFKAALADEQAGRLDEAIAKLNLTIRQAPLQGTVYRQLGVLLHKQERYAAALAAFRRALERLPDTAVQWSNIGITLRDMDRFDEGAEAMARACTLAPDNAKYAFRQGYCLLKAMRAGEAVEALDRAVALDDPDGDAALTLALALLTDGQLERGWPAYEARWGHKSSIAEPYPEKRWDGRPIKGTLLVSVEQGLGDTINFIRYAAMSRERCGRLVLRTHKGSESLMRRVAGVDDVILRGEEPPPFEAAIGLLSLPRVFGTTLETIPAPVSYVAPGEAEQEKARALFAPLQDLRKVGIVWAGNPKHAEDRRRSIPFEKFLELLDVPRVALVSLQKGARVEEAAASGVSGMVSDMQRRMETLEDTAALISALDLVIACDTAVAHLAGAMGKPVWILLSKTSDWRWLTEREDSPWYPSARLFRQKKEGDWDELFERVTAALKAMP